MEFAYFTFFRSYRDAVERIPEKYRFDMLKAIIDYGADCIEPDFDKYGEVGPFLRAVFIPIQQTIDNSHEIYHSNAEERNEGGRKKTFIEKYLSPVEKVSKRKLRTFFCNYFGKDLGDDVRKYIMRMKYDDFLNTIYWRSVALYVKENAGRTCSICGKNGGRFNVHHTTYEHHGDEINHMEDLICVCRDCHKKLHSKEK